MSRATTSLGSGPLRIAVVGAGISGLVAAHVLSQRHEVTVFEAEPRLGGHTHTVDVDVDRSGRSVPVDTGFIVFNDRTYPRFCALLDRLGVARRPTTMSFSVHCERTGLEYNGTSLNSMFAQRRNLLRPRFWGMLRDILRFHRDAEAFARGGATLRDVLAQGRYGREFGEHYLVPMMAAIWSAEPERLLGMPARFFVRFFANHGMLQVSDRPQWFTVAGGSRSYLEPLARPFAARLRLGCPVLRIDRGPSGVTVHAQAVGGESFDAVVLATHSDQALALLAAPSAREQAILGAIPYQENDVVLHTDRSLLPRRRLAWAAWNYRIPLVPQRRVAVTYCMNILQGLDCDAIVNVTLNQTAAIAADRVLRRFTYHHPVFDEAGVRAQAAVDGIQGGQRTWFCGAWCGFGFHEDGVAAALRVTADFGLDLDPAAARISA